MKQQQRSTSFLVTTALLLILFTIASSKLVISRKVGNGAALRPHPVLYEISTRPWLFELSNKYQRPGMKLRDVPDQEWQNLQQKGVNVIWLMGMWTIGKYGWARSTDLGARQNYGNDLPDYSLDDIIGSPYAIYQYSVNPDIGSDDDLRNIRAKLNSMGIALMLDFVPNHSACDAPEVTARSSLYVRVANGSPRPYQPSAYLPNGVANGKDPYFDPWTDTAQFNYWNAETRDFMRDNLEKVASFADYIRCDMAMLILNDIIDKTWGTLLRANGYSRPGSEFWADAISNVKSKYPSLKLLAEVYWGYETTLQSLGFDYTYDKNLYDKLTSGDMGELKGYVSSLSLKYLNNSAHFVENHDEDRAAHHFGTTSIAAAMVTNTLPGIRFNNHGQWEGKSHRLVVHLRRSADEPVDQNVLNFYNKFIPLLQDDVWHLGQWQYLNVNGGDSWKLLAWKWSYGDEKRLVVINYTTTSGGGSIIVPDAEPRGGSDMIPVVDLLTGNTYNRSASEMKSSGLNVVITPYNAQIFKY